MYDVIGLFTCLASMACIWAGYYWQDPWLFALGAVLYLGECVSMRRK